jgi:hypothetical protein
MKRLIAIFLAILQLFGVSGCGKPSGKASETPPRSTNAILRELVSAYGANACLPDAKTNALLDELRTADSEQGACWEQILSDWRSINEMPVNCDALPSDLPDDDSLVIIVLGFQLNADGSMQNELIERLKTALKCAEQYPNAYVLCTGGKTAMLSTETSEGEQMGKWLLKKGLDEKRLLIEGDSMTTAQNALYSYELLRKRCPQADTAVLVTSSYHIPWGALMFSSVFRLNAEDGSPALTLAAHSAYQTTYPGFGVQELLQCETSGMAEIVGAFYPAQVSETE